MEPWQIYAALGTAIVALCGYIKYLHNRIDALQEERVKFGEKMIAQLQAAATAARMGGGPSGGG